MKQFLLLLTTLCFFSLHTFAQSPKVIKLVKKGIALHDAGDYEGAIKQYKKAWKLDKKSTLINYELAFSYVELGDNKTALKYANKAIKGTGSDIPMVYVVKGNILDDLGKPAQAELTYQAGLEKFPDFYMLHFNRGVTNLRYGSPKIAEESFFNSILNEPTHGSSHFYLAQLKDLNNESIKAIMAYYFFLLVETDTPRSKQASDGIMKALKGNVTKKEGGGKEIQITINQMESEFSPIQLMLSLDVAAAIDKAIEEETDIEHKEKTEAEQLVYKTELVFSMLASMTESEEEERTGIWWDMYIPLFKEMHNNEFTPAFTYYCHQSRGGEYIDWLEANEDKMDAFFEWFKKMGQEE